MTITVETSVLQHVGSDLISHPSRTCPHPELDSGEVPHAVR